MKAAVCYELGQPLVVEEVELDAPHAGEVQVRVAAVAICHSDVHLVRGDWVNWSAPPPVVAGHEAAGVVAEVGVGVTDVRPGDRVVVSLIRWCGRCVQCTAGAPYLCEATFALASEHRLRNRRGEPLNMGIRTAAFAESVVVDRGHRLDGAGRGAPQRRRVRLTGSLLITRRQEGGRGPAPREWPGSPSGCPVYMLITYELGASLAR